MPARILDAHTAQPTSRRSEREFEFTRRDFDEIRRLIYTHAGISLSDAKEDMVYSRLARRLRARGISSFRAYLELLQHDAKEWEAFVNALTTNLTAFFREPHHFDILRDFLKTRRERPITIWSAAASTGEEPYSIAMTVVETLGDHAHGVRILASDLDTQVLQKAREGIYPADRIAKLDEARQRRFFLKGTGSRSGLVRIKPQLQAMIDFFQLNLLAEHWPIKQPLDAIFCRNVMIYFDKPTQYRILKRMKPLLKTDGLLFLGHSEALYHAADLFRLRGQTVYVHAFMPDKPA